MIPSNIRAAGRWGLAIALTAALPRPVHSRDVAVPLDSGAMPAAAADVQSLDAILHATYDVISGPAGPRNWQRFYSLFAPGARLIPTRHDSAGATHIQALTPEEFARFAAKYFANRPFYEREIGPGS